MKNVFKKAFSVAAASMLFAGAGLTAVNAAEITGGEGTITIANAQNGKTYTAYQIFEVSATNQNAGVVNPGVEFGDSDRTASYIATADQVTFFGGENSTLFNFEAAANGKYNVTVKTGIDGKAIAGFLNGKTDTELNAVFDSISKTAKSDGKLEIKPVPYGYYYVTSSTGTVASINTATPSVTITDKNKPTVVDKKVNDPAAFTVDKDHSTAYVGEVKNFEIATNIEPGLKSFTIEDTMGTGLAYVQDSLAVEINGIPATTNQVTSKVKGQVLTITFTETYLKEITASTSVKITYRATVTEAAVTAGETQNTVVVNPGTNSPVQDQVKVFLGKADFTKVDAKDDSTTLAGAEFEIYTQETGGTAIKFVKDDATNTYRYDRTGAEKSVATLISGTDGKFHVTGLPAGDYWLQETKAPAGYNLMTKRQKFTVTLNIPENGEPSVTKVETNIENTKGGSTLPSTGGMGTTALYTIGGMMVAGAAVLFVVRKRMTA